jgi:hypothetical protein
MKKILISLSIIGAVTVMVVSATRAYFTSTEKSVGNTFIAGAIDLTVDNECIFNGQVVGDCTWKTPKDLKGQALFNFKDVKPGDTGEDTISLHVDTNPAWVCAEVSNVKQFENGCNGPESKVDTTCGNPGEGQGELFQNLKFSLWMDNGVGDHSCNNIKDGDETYLVQNAPATDLKYAIADSQHGNGPIRSSCIGVEWSVPASVGNEAQTDSVTGDVTFNAYQARNNEKFLCNPPTTGTLTVIKHVVGGNGVASDFTINVTGTSPIPASFPGSESGTSVSLGAGDYSVSETPVSGYTPAYSAGCEGTIAAGEAKTCTITNSLDTATLTVIKHVVGGTIPASSFTMNVTGNIPSPASFAGSETGTDVTLLPGSYSVDEIGQSGYTKSLGTDCSGTISVGDHKTCTVTNSLDIGTVTIHKVVVNNDVGTKEPGNFQMTLDSVSAAQDTPITAAVGSHTVGEADSFGYVTTYSAECLNGVVNVPLNDNVTCTVTNTMPYFTVTVTKVVNNTHGGNNSFGDFNLFVGETPVTSGASKKVAVGTYLISESGVGGYSAAFSGDCNSDTQLLSGESGDTKTCTITNTDIEPNITLVKVVDSGSALPTAFTMRIDGGVPVPTGSSKLVTSNTAHSINEDAKAGYHFVSITGSAKCPSSLGGTVTLDEGEAITCTIHNAADNP